MSHGRSEEFHRRRVARAKAIRESIRVVRDLTDEFWRLEERKERLLRSILRPPRLIRRSL